MRIVQIFVLNKTCCRPVSTPLVRRHPVQTQALQNPHHYHRHRSIPSEPLTGKGVSTQRSLWASTPRQSSTRTSPSRCGYRTEDRTRPPTLETLSVILRTFRAPYPNFGLSYLQISGTLLSSSSTQTIGNVFRWPARNYNIYLPSRAWEGHLQSLRKLTTLVWGCGAHVNLGFFPTG